MKPRVKTSNAWTPGQREADRFTRDIEDDTQPPC